MPSANRFRLSFFMLLLTSFILISCRPAVAPTATPTATATQTSTPTATHTATATDTATNTATHTATATDTATATNTATDTATTTNTATDTATATNTATNTATATRTPTATLTPTPSPTPTPARPQTVQQSLTNLGVNTKPTKRIDDKGRILPDTFSPYGSTLALNKKDELFVVGIPLENRTENATLVEDFTDASSVVTPNVLTSFAPAVAPWSNVTTRAVASTSNPQVQRAITAGDVDGDGFEEVLILTSRQNALFLRIIDDKADGFQTAESQVPLEQNLVPKDVSIASGDVDGDGKADIAIAVSGVSQVTFMRFRVRAVNTASVASMTDPVSLTVSDATHYTSIKMGNIDYDNGLETVLVINSLQSTNSVDTGSTSYLVFDDLGGPSRIIKIGKVSIRVGDKDRPAVVADVALGDIDGDNLDEIVFAGLGNYTGAGSCDANDYVMMALDDSMHGMINLGTHLLKDSNDYCQDESANPVRYVYVNAPDLDGDRYAEVQVNQFIFEDWRNGAWIQLKTKDGRNSQIEENSLIASPGGNVKWVDRSSFMMSTGDVTGDGREDVISYTQVGGTAINVYGISQTNPNGGIARLTTLRTKFPNSESFLNPVVLPVNVDKDTPLLSFDVGTHQLVFTEPIIIAAIAAPPCYSPDSGVDQVTDACTSAFGQLNSTTTTKEQTVSVRAGVSFGFEVEERVFTQSEIALTASLSTTSSFIQGEAYSIEKSVVFTTGPLEDSVVFTSVPLDRYSYTILSHPDPALVGKHLLVNLPREPITIIVTRDFYNSNVSPGNLKIDNSIFQHTVGNPRSYLSLSAKNALKNNHVGHFLENGPQSVGQGDSNTLVAMAVGNTLSEGRALAIDFDLDVEGTVGSVMAGFSVGGGLEDALSIESSTSTQYVGTVGSLRDRNTFGANQYSFGLFTYVFKNPTNGQQFQVIDYWVQ